MPQEITETNGEPEMESLINEVTPEERLARVIQAIDQTGMTMLELAGVISPYVQLELIEAQHQERVICLSDFYHIREKLMDRERAAFQKNSELTQQILQRPEAK